MMTMIIDYRDVQLFCSCYFLLSFFGFFAQVFLSIPFCRRGDSSFLLLKRGLDIDNTSRYHGFLVLLSSLVLVCIPSWDLCSQLHPGVRG
jgi:hypothetical protein